MQLLQLQYFCTVARHGNISRAAQELWISQSALSKAIGSLEEELGVRLFDRVGRSIALNEAGKLYYQQVSGILPQINDATKQVRDLYKQSANSVDLLFSAANFMSGWLWRSFRTACPQVELRINSSYSVTHYDIQQSDFHIYATPDKYEHVESIPLVREGLVLAMDRSHPLAAKPSIRLEDTKAYAYQTLSPGENLRVNLAMFCGQAGFQPQIGFSTQDSYTFFSILASSNYLAMVPEVTAASALHKGLVLKKIEHPRCERTVYLSWNKSRYMSQDARLFLDFCKTLFAGEDIRRQLAGLDEGAQG